MTLDVSALMGLVALISDLRNGIRVASNVGNIRSEVGHARPSRSSYSLCMGHNRQTDGQTKAKLTASFPTERGHNKSSTETVFLNIPLPADR